MTSQHLVVCVAVIAVLVTLVVAYALLRGKDHRDFPFVSDMLRGVCPKCGVTGREPFKPSHGFWGHFHCARCGLSIKAHLRDG